ncbi:hypothetical protein ACJMK2_034224 [Sinanodonta woodiana]|uniref:Caspase-3 n=1 Tax=Sinanodonta woodiana TaxID=1069815 RepID=A0ABD3WRH4_SINWO
MDTQSDAVGHEETDAKGHEETDAKGHEETDAKGNPEGPSIPVPSSYIIDRPLMTKEDFESDVYNMDHENRGMAIIINNKTFQPHLRLPVRSGTDADSMALFSTFNAMGFDVKAYNDMTVQEMGQILYKASKEDEYHRQSDCFMCAILSHGEEGVIYGTDAKTDLQSLLRYFKGNACPGLVGKPKIFFIQACQGQKFDEGVALDVADAKGTMPKEISIKKIPSEADFLLAYSVVPGFYSWRNSRNGSWFIQALTEVLQKSWQSLDLLTILTRVNKKVALDFTSKTSDPTMSNKKQIPMITSMLTKEIKFKAKQNY